MKEKKSSKKLFLFILLYCCFAVAIIVYGANILTSRTDNPVGSILSFTGAFIWVLGFALVLIGNQEVDERFSLWEDEVVQIPYRSPETVSYPFHLEKFSVIRGNISGKAGPFEYVIVDFFQTAETAGPHRDLHEVRPRKYTKDKWDSGETDIGPLSLPPGTYALRFEDYPQIQASFTLNGTYRKKPYENFYNLGLTLLEVGLPIFITGAIFLGCGTLI